MRSQKQTLSLAMRSAARLLVFLAALSTHLCGAHAEETFNPQLFVIQADGKGLQQITHDDQRHFGSAQWSPDGKEIVADCWLAKDFGEQSYAITRLVLMNFDGSGSKDLGLGAMPSWSPDGTQLVCHTYVPKNQMVVMNADGTGREMVADHWGSPRWSPQGRWIATLSQGKFGMLDLAEGAETLARVPRGFAPALGFAWSRDGKRICFTDRDENGLNLIEFDSQWKCQRLVHIATNLKCGLASSWSPDGKKIVFASAPTKPSISQLYVVDLESDAKPVRLAGQPENRANSAPNWSPDGQSIVFSSVVPKKQ